MGGAGRVPRRVRMDRGSSSEEYDEDSEDNVPIAVAFGTQRLGPAPTSKNTGTATTAATASKTTPVINSKRPLAEEPTTTKLVVAKKPKAAPEPSKTAARPVVAKPVSSKPPAAVSSASGSIQRSAAKAYTKHDSSTGSDDMSSESEADDLSGDNGDETSSEEDDESVDNDDDNGASASVQRRSAVGSTTRAPPPSATTTNAVPVVGVLVSSPARTAVERLNSALEALDGSSAPLGAQEGIRKSKRVFSGDVSNVIQKLSEGNRLTDAHVSSLLCATSLVALQLASVAAGPGDVNREIQCFRRAAHQMHTTWDTTLPQLEALADASRKQQEAAAHASRVAAELLGSHTALANCVANALEDLKRGR